MLCNSNTHNQWQLQIIMITVCNVNSVFWSTDTNTLYCLNKFYPSLATMIYVMDSPHKVKKEAIVMSHPLSQCWIHTTDVRHNFTFLNGLEAMHSHKINDQQCHIFDEKHSIGRSLMVQSWILMTPHDQVLAHLFPWNYHSHHHWHLCHGLWHQN